MLITRLYLRNFRVFESELDLSVPPGLVGIYGPNGAGKSTLLEAISFTLWGRARTAREDIRTAGVRSDCITEVEFEHEGHLYVVTRRLSGINSTPRASVTCDGLQMTEGVRDVGRYVHSLLGMDDAAFRASVFAEQKQLAAFSGQTPAERRRLVLELLGVTPLDVARDAARRDAREARQAHERLRSLLPDTAALDQAAGDAEAAAAAADVVAAEAVAVRTTAERRLATAVEAVRSLDGIRQVYDGLVIEGRAVRATADGEAAVVAERRRELDDLDADGVRLAELEASGQDLSADEALLGPLSALAGAASRVAASPTPDAVDRPDPSAQLAAEAADGEVRQSLATVEGEQRAVTGELARAREAEHRSAGLSGAGDCPLCGQALGAAWEQVVAHRRTEVAAVAGRLAALDDSLEATRGVARTALGRLRTETDALAAAESRRASWQQAADRRSEAVDALVRARGTVAAVRTAGIVGGGRSEGAATSEAGGEAVGAEHTVDGDGDSDGEEVSDDQRAADLGTEVEVLAARVAAGRRAAEAAQRIRGRLEGRGRIEEALQAATGRLRTAEDQLGALRDKVRALRFDPAALVVARAAADDAAATTTSAADRAEAAASAAERRRREADLAAARADDARRQHRLLADEAVRSVHLGRVADLLSEFRNTVVASVGPRLAVQAAELFAELTDHEYDRLDVNAETFGLQISDAGRLYGLERFSGSEIDLANLALRVAISEHIRFQSGGSVGLLVLDEVFGPLDEQRKERMLGALERLRGRFRQVLVVTHDSTIKEQLPNAIEVVKLPGRRATARLLAG